MVFRHINKDIKDRILWLRGNGCVIEDICDTFGVSLQGRPHFPNANQRHDLFTMLEESPGLFLDEIQGIRTRLLFLMTSGYQSLHFTILSLLHKGASGHDEGAREAFRTVVAQNKYM
ncbi:hypothetical protein BJV78DRAFT_1258305 [Lactifluus subvellereus]|nr:hypothetical protein BJV78DRAFT_1258305 [Lactifluus subvellereus]